MPSGFVRDSAFSQLSRILDSAEFALGCGCVKIGTSFFYIKARFCRISEFGSINIREFVTRIVTKRQNVRIKATFFSAVEIANSHFLSKPNCKFDLTSGVFDSAEFPRSTSLVLPNFRIRQHQYTRVCNSHCRKATKCTHKSNVFSAVGILASLR